MNLILKDHRDSRNPFLLEDGERDRGPNVVVETKRCGNLLNVVDGGGREEAEHSPKLCSTGDSEG
jgi:hypothetical protein